MVSAYAIYRWIISACEVFHGDDDQPWPDYGDGSATIQEWMGCDSDPLQSTIKSSVGDEYMSEEYSLEGARDSLGQSIDGYRSANFRARFTKVDAIMWITTKNLGDHTPVARVEYPRWQFVAITLEPEPRVIGDLPMYIRGQARRWVQQNLHILLSYWNEEINTSDALDQLTAIGRYDRDVRELNQTERTYLLTINDRLKKIQDQVKQEAERIIPQLRNRVADKTDPLVDFELEVNITYHLREDDPEWQENDDNILLEQNEWVTRVLETSEREHGAFSSYNWNDMQFIDGHPFQHEHHCWFYHDLYDHHYLDFKDLLRIGWMWVDIKTIYQYIEDIEGKQDGWRKE